VILITIFAAIRHLFQHPAGNYADGRSDVSYARLPCMSRRGLSYLEVVMKVILDRGLCDASLSFCQRCSAAFLRHPEGYDRHCIRDIIDDGRDMLTLEMYTDGRVLEIELTDEMRDLASIEGWEVLADFDPAFFRTGAMERWHQLKTIPAVHTTP
jgi:hypothetical protein